MSRAEAEAIQKAGQVLSKGQLRELQGLGSAAEEGLAARMWHSWRPSLLGSPPTTPYVSASGISKVAGGYAQGADRVVLRLVLRRADLVRGLNPHQAEYLIRGGARVAEYSEMTALGWGPAGELVRAGAWTGALGASSVYGGYKAGTMIAGDQ